MVLFDHNGVLRKYESVLDILREFFPVRLEFYAKRKRYYEGMLGAEALKLENQARFIMEKNDKKIIMENIKKKEFIQVLIQRNYDSDPVKAWKAQNQIEEEKDDNDDDGSQTPQASEEDKKYDFDYLIDMTMRSMLRENVAELLKKRDAKKDELENLRRSTPQMLWERDLDSFMEELNRVEQLERDNASKSIKPSKKIAKISAKGLKVTNSAAIYKPSSDAERIEPKIDFDKYMPKEKKERKKPEKKAKGEEKKKKKDDDTPNDQMKLTTMMAASAAAVASPSDDTKSSDDNPVLMPVNPVRKMKLKQSTLNFGKKALVSDSTSDSTSTTTKKPEQKRKSSDYDDDDESVVVKVSCAQMFAISVT